MIPIPHNAVKAVVGLGTDYLHSHFMESGSQAHIRIGLVVGVCQQKQVHMVRCAGHQFFCPSINATGNPFYGSRASHLLPIGSYVVVLTSDEQGRAHGAIIGAFPPSSVNLLKEREMSFTMSPELVPGTPVGPHKDKISSEALKKGIAKDPALNKNTGRAIDAYPGDVVDLTELGCGVWTGRAVTVLRAGHDVGVECHYVDSLLRLSGFNFEQFTAGADLTAFNDDGLYTEIKRLSPYPIESMGSTNPEGQVPNKKGQPRKSKTGTASHVPEDAEQAGYWRYLKLTGHLGDIETTYVSTVSEDAQEPRTAGPSFQSNQDTHGVFKRTVGTDGAYMVQSAKSIAFVKDIMIPVPTEVYRPDDPRGSGGSAEEDEYTPPDTRTDIEFKEDTAYSRAVHTHDTIAHQSNYLATLPIQKHTKTEGGLDWDLKEVSELKFGTETGKSWDELKPISKGKFWADLPKVANIKVDHREEEGTFFVSKSCIMMHEDGSIHLEDGYGGQISMRGGNIDISCPGTITTRPGNDMVSIVGRSISHIAGENIESTAMLGDVRVHGNRNVTILGGNDGRGGILIESKANTAHIGASANDLQIEDPKNNLNAYGGIWLKSRQGTVSVLGKQTYIGCDNDGLVLLDGNEEGTVLVTGKSLTTNTENLYFVAGDPDDLEAGCHIGFNNNGQGVLRINDGFSVFADKLFGAGAGGQGARMRAILAGNLFVEESVLSKTVADDMDAGDDFDQAVEDATDANQATIEESSTALQEFNDLLENSIARDIEGLKNLTFAYPTTEERGLPGEGGEGDKLILAEASWQTRYRAGEHAEYLQFTAVDPSEEQGTSPVVASDTTSCWPGASAFESAYAQVKHKFIDPETGAALDRADNGEYDKPINEEEQLTPGPLTQYLINTENKEPGQQNE